MQGFDGAALDRWLTTDPREADAAAFEAWCDENDSDDYDAFEQEMADRAEDAAEARAEAARDREFDTSSDW